MIPSYTYADQHALTDVSQTGMNHTDTEIKIKYSHKGFTVFKTLMKLYHLHIYLVDYQDSIFGATFVYGVHLRETETEA